MYGESGRRGRRPGRPWNVPLRFHDIATAPGGSGRRFRPRPLGRRGRLPRTRCSTTRARRRTIFDVADHPADGLVQRLNAMTDRERIEFARWAVEQPAPPAVVLAYGRTHAARVAAERAAGRAFGTFRGDGTVGDLPWDYAIEAHPGSDWGEWEAAAALVRAMAAALVVGDRLAITRLQPAFAYLGVALPPH